MGRASRLFAVLWLCLAVLTGCGTERARPTPAEPTAPASLSQMPSTTLDLEDPLEAAGLTPDETATLGSLAQVDDYPLYAMRFHGAYRQPDSAAGANTVAPAAGWPGSGRRESARTVPVTAWACSLFAALADEGGRVYGRNFDWQFSPGMLLFTDPPDGYASVSMVDIAYLGFEGQRAQGIADLPLEARRDLLDAPLWPFDGMNEHGLAVGMAAVPAGQGPPDPEKGTVGSLGIIRLMLDRARDVAEAVALLRRHNIEMDGGPDLHYLLADRSGGSALVEFYAGEMVVLQNDQPWHLATNFLRAAAGTSASGRCWRYDRLEQGLVHSGGHLGAAPAMELLATVAGDMTQWSVVYQMSTGTIQVAMGRQYDLPHSFHLPLVDMHKSESDEP